MLNVIISNVIVGIVIRSIVIRSNVIRSNVIRSNVTINVVMPNFLPSLRGSMVWIMSWRRPGFKVKNFFFFFVKPHSRTIDKSLADAIS
jgi:hypothetical protein